MLTCSTLLRRLESWGVRIVSVSGGYDLKRKALKVQRAVKGLTNELYIDDLRDKTLRGLEGRARKGWNT